MLYSFMSGVRVRILMRELHGMNGYKAAIMEDNERTSLLASLRSERQSERDI